MEQRYIYEGLNQPRDFFYIRQTSNELIEIWFVGFLTIIDMTYLFKIKWNA